MAIFVTFKTKDTMKSFFILLSLYYFLVVNVVSADSVTFPSRVEIVMDEDFDLPGGPGCSSFYSFGYSFFSIFEWWPFHWFGILSIDRWSGIAISQNGNVVYSSAENIDSPILRKVQLQQGLGGDFLLEIKGADGAYAFGRFTVHWFDNEYITLWNKSHFASLAWTGLLSTKS